MFSHYVTAAILVFQNNETTAMLVFQTNPVGVELFSYVKTFVNLFQKICTGAGHVSKNALYQIALNLVQYGGRREDLLSCRRHIKKREDPDDEVGWLFRQHIG